MTAFFERPLSLVLQPGLELLIVWEFIMLLLAFRFPSLLLEIGICGMVLLPAALVLALRSAPLHVGAEESGNASASSNDCTTKAAGRQTSKTEKDNSATGAFAPTVGSVLMCLFGMLLVNELVVMRLVNYFSAEVVEVAIVGLCMAFFAIAIFVFGTGRKPLVSKDSDSTKLASTASTDCDCSPPSRVPSSPPVSRCSTPPVPRCSAPPSRCSKDDASTTRLPEISASNSESIEMDVRAPTDEPETVEVPDTTSVAAPAMETGSEVMDNVEANQDALVAANEAAGKIVWADVDEDDDFMLRVPEAPRLDIQQGEALLPGKQTGTDAGGNAWEEGKASGGKARGKGGKYGQHCPRSQVHSAEFIATKNCVAKIRACGRVRDAAGAVAAAREAAAAGVAPDVELQNALLCALARCGEGDGKSSEELAAATKLFEKMKTSSCADVVSFNIMLRSLLCAGKHEEARKHLDEMKAFGFTANKVTFNELLSDRVKVGDRAGTWKVIAEVKDAGLGINKVACSIMLKSLGESSSSEEVQKTLELLDDLDEPADEVLCSAAIEAFLRVKEYATLATFLKTLSNAGIGNGRVNVSASTYGSIIKAYGQEKDVDRAYATWNTMLDSGVSPSAMTLGCMVEALVTNTSVDAAWSLVQDMIAHPEHVKCVNTVIYSTVLKGFSYANQPKRCFAVLDEMHARGIQANTITYNTLLDACAKCGTMDRVPQVFEDMKSANIEPDMITYSTLVKGYCLVGHLDCALELLEEMKHDGKLKLDEIVYNSLLDGCGRAHKIDRATAVLEDMLTSGVRPSNYTLSIMTKMLGRAKRLKDAFALLEEFRASYNIRANLQVYTCLIGACLQNREVARALSTHDIMIRELDRTPDAKAYSVLLNGCIQAGAYAEAVRVARCAYGLPGHGLAVPSARGAAYNNNRGATGPPGLETRLIKELSVKIMREEDAGELMKDWEEVLEKSGCSWPAANTSTEGRYQQRGRGNGGQGGAYSNGGQGAGGRRGGDARAGRNHAYNQPRDQQYGQQRDQQYGQQRGARGQQHSDAY